MNQKQLAELKKLAQKATPGPWVANTDGDGSLCEAKYPDGERHIIIEPAEWDDAEYIAAVNPQVILEVIESMEYLEELKKEKAEYYMQFDKLAEVMGVFKETDPGKPETFSVFRREFEKLKAQNRLLEQEANFLATEVLDWEMDQATPGQKVRTLAKIREEACKAVEKR